MLQSPSPTVPRLGKLVGNFLVPPLPLDWYPDDVDCPLSDVASNELFEPVCKDLSDICKF